MKTETSTKVLREKALHSSDSTYLEPGGIVPPAELHVNVPEHGDADGEAQRPRHRQDGRRGAVRQAHVVHGAHHGLQRDAGKEETKISILDEYR